MQTIPLDHPALQQNNWLLDDVDDEIEERLDRLSHLATLGRWAKFNLRALMVEAVEAGYTYQDIADAIGVSRQAAWEAINPKNGAPLSVNLDQLKLF